MNGNAPRGTGRRTKTDLRAGKLSGMAWHAPGKTRPATTDAEQDFLLGKEDARDAPLLPPSAPGEMEE